MATLPVGTVTFFFSDLEGSTRLLEALGRDYDDLLARHREIARDAFGRCAAVELGTEGDSFMAVFPAATDAITAAVAIQRATAAEDWPQGATVRVRIGLHTGEARLSGGDYVGLEVHRAARIMATAHGGQILVSDATRSLVERSLAEGLQLLDLGRHRLRDLSTEERLFQVVAAGLPADFPALRTLDATPNNLPAQTSDLVGRGPELRAIRDLLQSSTVRLVTLTGPGGIGKTRLALQAAADVLDAFPDGMYFVDVSAARDSDAALQSIARTLGVAPSGDEPLGEALARHLRTGRRLLLLDNFEQVVVAADDIARVLGKCSALKLLVTSREALRVRGEQVFPLSPLSLPPVRSASVKAEDVSGFDAVRLFVQRAREAHPSFELTDANAAVILDICASLDGLPLALELAAARLKLFSPEELRDRLRSRLELLRGGARDLPERHRTLRGAIEWSYELLDEEERRLFRLMALFESASVDAVEEVAAGLGDVAGADIVDMLVSLVDKSLVRSTETATGRRLAMLETIREYATEQLAADPNLDRAARQEHAEYFARFAEHRHPLLGGPNREGTLTELARELGNLQAAWRHFLASADVGRLNTLLDPLWTLHDARGWYHGAAALANDLLSVLTGAPPDADRADDEITLRMTLARALLALRGYTEEVETLYRDAHAVAGATALPRRLSVLRSLASFYLYRAEVDKSAAVGREILELGEQQDDTGIRVEGLIILGPALAFRGDVPLGLEHLDRATAMFDAGLHGPTRLRLGPSPGVVAPAVGGLLSWVNGDVDSAARRAATALEVAARLQHPYSLAYATFHVALLDLWNRRWAVAGERAAALLEIAEEHDYGVWKAVALVLQGVTTAALGRPESGLEQTERGIALYENLRTPPVFWPSVLSLKAHVCAMAGRTADALALIDQAAALAEQGSWDSASLEVQRADVFVSLGAADDAEASARQAFREAQRAGARMIQLQALTRLAPLERRLGRTDATEILGALLQEFTEGTDNPDVIDARAALGDFRLNGA